jgi:hypothetical protein
MQGNAALQAHLSPPTCYNWQTFAISFNHPVLLKFHLTLRTSVAVVLQIRCAIPANFD